jgi:hypothetical protein
MDAQVMRLLEASGVKHSLDQSRGVALIVYRMNTGKMQSITVSGGTHQVRGASYFKVSAEVVRAPSAAEVGRVVRAVGLRLFGGLCMDGDRLLFKADLPVSIAVDAFVEVTQQCAGVAYFAEKVLAED